MKERKIEIAVWQGTFEEAEEREIELYANKDWKDSARDVEEMRRMIWAEEYEKDKVDWVFRTRHLKDEIDDFE